MDEYLNMFTTSFVLQFKIKKAYLYFKSLFIKHKCRPPFKLNLQSCQDFRHTQISFHLIVVKGNTYGCRNNCNASF